MTRPSLLAPGIRRTPIRDLPVFGLAASLALAAALVSSVAVARRGWTTPSAAADLRILFRSPAVPAAERRELRERTLPAITGEAGSVCSVAFTILNTGGADAYAVVVDAYTALGPAGVARRFQPGPGAGRSVEGAVHLPLFVGMRELCLKARLQTVTDDAMGDPNPRDNQACRPLVVHPASDGGAPTEGCSPGKHDL